MHPGMDRHELLGTFYLLRGAAPEDLAAVDALVDRRRYAAQEFVFSEDDKPEAMYLLERGTIEILKARDETAIATIGPGDAFGELAFFDEAKRSALRRRTAPARRPRRPPPPGRAARGRRGGPGAAPHPRGFPPAGPGGWGWPCRPARGGPRPRAPGGGWVGWESERPTARARPL